MSNTVTEIFANLVREGRIRPESLVGCRDEEVSLVAAHFGCTLPKSYEEFLRIAGRSAGKLFGGTDIFYPGVLDLQSEAGNLLAEMNQPQILEAKVFCMHQGYEIDYFLPGSDDPPIFQYVEGEPAATKPWRSFSAFVEQAITNHLSQWPILD